MAIQSEDMFDAMVKIAGRDVMRKDAEAMPAEGDMDITFTPGFERKMRKLMKRHQRNARSLPVKIVQFAAACVAILALTFTSAFALAPPFRERVVKAVIEWTGISAGFTFAENDGIRPAYIPDGFIEVDYWEDEAWVDIEYFDDSETEVFFSRRSLDGLKMSIDSEHSDYRMEIIFDFEAHVFTSNTEGYPSYVLFNDGAYAYLFSGEIPVDELLLMARSLPLKK